jgi:hypothetical protein
LSSSKKPRPRAPTLREKVDVYERLLHDLHFHSTVTMRHDSVMECLRRISAWSYAHRAGNGEPTEREQQDMVNHAFWQLEKPLP